MISFWRPNGVAWGNNWPAAEELNDLLAAGWTIVAVLPPDSMAGNMPTFVLQNRERWRGRLGERRVPWYKRLWQRVVRPT